MTKEKVESKKKKTTVKSKKTASKAEKAVKTEHIGLQRPPIVAVLGHVDHGKTSLLDAIRGTSVQAGEVGGITQSVRAHQIVTKSGQKITFIDTPGHEAFSSMRSRGAQVTDVVLLVVAADDGIQPQTKESIEFAKKAGAHIIVAANKIDLPGVNLDKLKNELSANDVLIEEYGGEAMFVPVSAVKKTGLDDLVERILLLAEVHGIKNEKPAVGIARAVVLESTNDKRLGSIALVLVKEGAFKTGDYVESEKGVSKVRTILDEFQKTQVGAETSDPVWIVGLSDVVETGEVINLFESESEAKDYHKEKRAGQMEEEKEIVKAEKEEAALNDAEMTDTDLLARLLGQNQTEDDKKKLNVVIKTDALGTLEAVLSELKKLNDKDVEVNVLSSATGEVNESDILRAKSARGIVLAFRVNVPKEIENFAKKERVLLRKYQIIYEMVDEVGAALDSLLDPEEEEIEVARARVKKVFVLTNGTTVAGSEVIKGKIIRGYKVFVERAGERVHDGKITLLKQNKNEVKEIDKGLDCGIFIEPNFEVQEGDEVVAYKVEKY